MNYDPIALRKEITEKANPVLYGMWTAYGALSASLIAAVSVLFTGIPGASPIAASTSILFGILVVMLVARSFRAHVVMYEALIDLHCPLEKIDPERRIKAEQLIKQSGRDTVIRDIWLQWLVIAQVGAMLLVLLPLLPSICNCVVR